MLVDVCSQLFWTRVRLPPSPLYFDKEQRTMRCSLFLTAFKLLKEIPANDQSLPGDLVPVDRLGEQNVVEVALYNRLAPILTTGG
jgi:hypothetical protein